MTPEVPGFLEEEENVCNIYVQSYFYAALLYLPSSLVRITSVSRHERITQRLNLTNTSLQ